ncbi:hypothetical protein [Microcoleus sp. N9_A1]|uniref:hypothetical protein n=1 Tax=Microcoleus sp. N9_A1 TaxID=3055380 RepID=UPI002FCF84DA
MEFAYTGKKGGCKRLKEAQCLHTPTESFMARFSDIYRADELKAAADALELWRRKTAAEKKALYATATAVAGGKRLNRSTKVGFIQPFGAPDNFWYETKILASATEAPTANEENVASLITAVTTAVISFVLPSVPVGANNLSNQAKKVQFAKVRCSEKSGAGVPTTSRLTSRPYTKYNSNTASSSFGASVLIKEEPAVAKLIRASLMPATPVAGRSIGFSSQGNVGNVTKAAAA